jgi:hypothetical protein
MKYRKFFLELATMAIVTIALIAAAGGLFLLGSWLLNWLLPQVAHLVGSILINVLRVFAGGLLLLGLLVWSISNMRVKRLDRRRLKLLRKNVPTSRERIAEEFKFFQKTEFRLEFVKLLGSHGIKPTGSWPNGEMPNYRNDEASTLLAQLEEKWLGLNR